MRVHTTKHDENMFQLCYGFSPDVSKKGGHFQDTIVDEKAALLIRKPFLHVTNM